ncbi:MAG TPA: zf-HC2 domain-containing protein [Dyella sp.]|uniref:zf-HC2 domain-containing protein n=1 Tax=Dyella sp. TaxID=1869338 RepID=UPI002F94F0F6
MTFPKDSNRDCARAWEAMPWVLQDSAPAEQGQWLHNHLAECPSCSEEFAQQSRLRLAMSLPTDIQLDPAVGLKRLYARLDNPQIEEAPRRVRAGGWLTRALVAAVLVQALGIGFLGLRLWSQDAGSPYRTLSQDTLPMPAGAIHVVPDETMKLADWNTLLRHLHLQVVGGPNDVGAYTVVPVGAAAPQALQQLRATRGIRLAEPVAATP